MACRPSWRTERGTAAASRELHHIRRDEAAAATVDHSRHEFDGMPERAAKAAAVDRAGQLAYRAAAEQEAVVTDRDLDRLEVRGAPYFSMPGWGGAYANQAAVSLCSSG